MGRPFLKYVSVVAEDNMVQYMDEELIASENVGQWWWWGGDRQHASIHRGWNPIIAETSWIERYQ